MVQVYFVRLFFLRNGQETVAWVFFNFAVFWKINWVTLRVLLYLSKEKDSLWLATTKCDFGAVQVVCNAL